MIKQLIRLANHLDNKGFVKEANYLDAVIKKASTEDSMGEVVSLDSFRQDDAPKFARIFEISGTGIWGNNADMHIMPYELYEELVRNNEDIDQFIKTNDNQIQTTNLNMYIGLRDLE